MVPIRLKRLVAKSEVKEILARLQALSATSVSIQDREGQTIWGTPTESSKYPIQVDGELIGYVIGEATFASVLSYIAAREIEKKTLAQETLDRYKEVTLLHNLSEKMTASLEVEAVAALVLSEAKRSIQSDCGAVMLLKSSELEVVTAFGNSPTQLQGGILEAVLEHQKSDIVNEVFSDARCNSEEAKLHALIAAPLKVSDRTIGVMMLGSEQAITYTAADLKLLNTLASQAASALENALLHKQRLHQERVKSNLERYVPAQLVQAILDASGSFSLVPEYRQISVLFSDIRNFTQQCEQLPPTEMVEYLNTYFTHMVDEIFIHQGTVNKFVGDMIVALFGAPFEVSHHETCAIKSAIAMQQRIRTIPIDWIQKHFLTGIGISSGRVIVGNIGSPQHMDYTAIGDEVNVASRLQSVAKGGQILVNRNVYEAAKDCFSFREVGTLTVKGKTQTVDVFEVLY